MVSSLEAVLATRHAALHMGVADELGTMQANAFVECCDTIDQGSYG